MPPKTSAPPPPARVHPETEIILPRYIATVLEPKENAADPSQKGSIIRHLTSSKTNEKYVGEVALCTMTAEDATSNEAPSSLSSSPQTQQIEKRSGDGALLWPNGNCYMGQWKDGAMNGVGTFLYAVEGDKYVGSFVDDKKHGPNGLYTFANGNYFQGDFHNDKRHGSGRYVWTCGDSYEGEWKDGHMEGKGRTQYANGNTYEGDFVYDRREGFGTLRCADGLSYTGQWVKNMRHGAFGKLSFPNGDYFEGAWANDRKHGVGKDVVVGQIHPSEPRSSSDNKVGEEGDKTIAAANTASCYHGEYKENVKDGLGVMQYGRTVVVANTADGVGAADSVATNSISSSGGPSSSSSSPSFLPTGDSYSGRWVKDKMHGDRGVYVFRSTGHVYVGGWKENARDGHGVYFYPPLTTPTSPSSTTLFSDSTKYHRLLNTPPVFNKEAMEAAESAPLLFNGVSDANANSSPSSFSNGSYYDGEWVKDKRHGKGILRVQNALYQEEKEKQRQLQQELDATTLKEGEEEPEESRQHLLSSHPYLFYEGTWNAGKMHGAFTVSSGVLPSSSFASAAEKSSKGGGGAYSLKKPPILLFSGEWKDGTLLKGTYHQQRFPSWLAAKIETPAASATEDEVNALKKLKQKQQNALKQHFDVSGSFAPLTAATPAASSFPNIHASPPSPNPPPSFPPPLTLGGDQLVPLLSPTHLMMAAFVADFDNLTAFFARHQQHFLFSHRDEKGESNILKGGIRDDNVSLFDDENEDDSKGDDSGRKSKGAKEEVNNGGQISRNNSSSRLTSSASAAKRTPSAAATSLKRSNSSASATITTTTTANANKSSSSNVTHVRSSSAALTASSGASATPSKPRRDSAASSASSPAALPAKSSGATKKKLSTPPPLPPSSPATTSASSQQDDGVAARPPKVIQESLARTRASDLAAVVAVAKRDYIGIDTVIAPLQKALAMARRFEEASKAHLEAEEKALEAMLKGELPIVRSGGDIDGSSAKLLKNKKASSSSSLRSAANTNGGGGGGKSENKSSLIPAVLAEVERRLAAFNNAKSDPNFDPTTTANEEDPKKEAERSAILKAKQEALEAAKAKREKMEATLKEKKQRLADAKAVAKLVKDRDAARAKKEALEKASAALQGKDGEEEVGDAEKGSKKQQTPVGEMSIATLRARLTQMEAKKADILSKRSSLSALKGEISEKEATLEALKKQHETLSKAAEKQNREQMLAKANSKKKHNELMEQLYAIEKESAKYQAVIDADNERKKAENAANESSENELAELEQYVKQLETNKADLKNLIATQEADIKRLTEEAARRKEKSERNKGLGKEKEALEEQIEVVQKRIKARKDAMAVAQKERDAELLDAQGKLATAEAQLNETLAKLNGGRSGGGVGTAAPQSVHNISASSLSSSGASTPPPPPAPPAVASSSRHASTSSAASSSSLAATPPPLPAPPAAAVGRLRRKDSQALATAAAFLSTTTQESSTTNSGTSISTETQAAFDKTKERTMRAQLAEKRKILEDLKEQVASAEKKREELKLSDEKNKRTSGAAREIVFNQLRKLRTVFTKLTNEKTLLTSRLDQLRKDGGDADDDDDGGQKRSAAVDYGLSEEDISKIFIQLKPNEANHWKLNYLRNQLEQRAATIKDLQRETSRNALLEEQINALRAELKS